MILLLFCAQQAFAIEAVVSHTVFYNQNPAQSGKYGPAVEIYWQINPNTLHYTSNADKTMSGKIKAEITLSNNSGIIKYDLHYIKTLPIKSVNEILDQSIMDLRRFEIPAGFVKVKLLITDGNDSINRFSFTDSFTIAPKPEAYFYSGLQLLDTAYHDNTETAFLKNGNQHIPFCTNFLDDNRRMIYYYGELYGAGKIAASEYPLIQKIAISKNENEGSFADLIHTDTIREQEPVTALSGKFHLGLLPSGNYYLHVELENQSHDVIASESLFFQRLNKHPLIPDSFKKNTTKNDTGFESVTVLNLKKTFVAKYTLAQIRAILKMLRPISDQVGVRTIDGFLKKPDDLYMRYYIYNYFLNINKVDPTRAWKDFSARITEINKLFNSGNTPGYETERGYIYMRYGAPTDIITVENEQGALPYEVWQYNTLTLLSKKDVPNAVFLFYKPNQMTSDYRLLHSTVENEIQNLSWRATLYTNAQGGDNSNSRAEQYLGNR
jgi:GWxTD domain-containing protein